MPDPVAVVGGSGFVGAAVVAELRARGVLVWTVPAPRLSWRPAELRAAGRPAGPPLDRETVAALAAALDGGTVAARAAALDGETVAALAAALDGARVVVNAAGIADGTAPSSAALFGANALLPALVARAALAAGAARVVHISSAAVQGRGVLDETPLTDPFSPYSRSKALGERLVREAAGPVVVFRPTWVHGAGRPNTRGLVRLARSAYACVAGDGTAPTPQVLIADVAAACAHLALTLDVVPPIVLQPPGGMTTGRLLRLLGGREPRRLPVAAARCLTGALRAAAPLSGGAHAVARRAEMVLFGRDQVPGWLARRGVVAPLDPEAWTRLATVDEQHAAPVEHG